MLLALAALFLNVGPQIEALPIAAAVPAASAVSQPVAVADATPDADVVATHAPTPAPDSLKSSAEPISAESASGSAPASYSALRAAVVGNAQNSQSLSTVRIPDSAEPKFSGVIAAERMPSRKTWLLLAFAQHGAAAFDAYSTRVAVAQGAVERDPFMRPFANSGAIYAAIQVAPLAFDYAARRMQRSPNNFVRRMWWMPQSVSTAAFIVSGVHDLGVAH